MSNPYVRFTSYSRRAHRGDDTALFSAAAMLCELADGDGRRLSVVAAQLS